ncbi:MAG: sugar phosphate isomerase/epimerase [Firmicutes bacterium]|nr:sugar phosphate isomerase/epimerase [Bacillota bacterium]
MNIPIGLQLFSLREDAARDFIGVLNEVAKMGYAGVEFAGYHGVSAPELKKVLNDLGLTPIGSHISYKELDENLSEMIEYNLEIGSPYLVCPSAPRYLLENATADDWKSFAAKMSDIGAEAKKHGLKLAYHCHTLEFEIFDGEYALDIFYDNVDPDNVTAEMDAGWIFHAGIDPVEYLKKYKGRCPLLHVKDFKKDGEQTEVGTGDIDLAGIVGVAKDVGVTWYVIETERYNMAPIDSVRVGLENLKAVIEKA